MDTTAILKKSAGNSVAQGNVTTRDIIVQKGKNDTCVLPTHFALQIVQLLLLVCILAYAARIQTMIADHAKNVDSINRHTTLTMGLNAAEEKAWILSEMRNIGNNGKRMDEGKLARSSNFANSPDKHDFTGYHPRYCGDDIR